MKAPLLTCNMCREQKARNEFYLNESRGTGRTARCKTCDKKRYDERRAYFIGYMANDKKENPHKWKARQDARTKLKKLPCVVCKSAKSEAHHPDYEKPLDVIWLCRQHHFDVERGVLVV